MGQEATNYAVFHFNPREGFDDSPICETELEAYHKVVEIFKELYFETYNKEISTEEALDEFDSFCETTGHMFMVSPINVSAKD